MEGGKEQNYWPGFVDALSNVVLTLVFVLVIFVFALVMASNKVEQKMKDVVEQQQVEKAKQAAQQSQKEQQDQSMAEQVAQLQQQLVSANTEIEKLRKQNEKSATEKSQSGATAQSAVSAQNDKMHIVIDDKAQSKANMGAVNIKSTENTITLGFPLQIAEMDEKSTTQLGHVLEAVQKNMGKHKVIIRSIIGRETYSAAQRLAYYRAIGARNHLITKAGEDPSNISTTIVKPEKPEDGRVEIIFKKQ